MVCYLAKDSFASPCVQYKWIPCVRYVSVLCVHFVESPDWLGKLHNVNIGNSKNITKSRIISYKMCVLCLLPGRGKKRGLLVPTLLLNCSKLHHQIGKLWYCGIHHHVLKWFKVYQYLHLIKCSLYHRQQSDILSMISKEACHEAHQLWILSQLP